jgi:hypothetical protein
MHQRDPSGPGYPVVRFDRPELDSGHVVVSIDDEHLVTGTPAEVTSVLRARGWGITVDESFAVKPDPSPMPRTSWSTRPPVVTPPWRGQNTWTPAPGVYRSNPVLDIDTTVDPYDPTVRVGGHGWGPPVIGSFYDELKRASELLDADRIQVEPRTTIVESGRRYGKSRMGFVRACEAAGIDTVDAIEMFEASQRGEDDATLARMAREHIARARRRRMLEHARPEQLEAMREGTQISRAYMADRPHHVAVVRPAPAKPTKRRKWRPFR